MNIFSTFCSSTTLFLKDNFSRSLPERLSPRCKKIGIIAAAAFCCLAVCYAIYRISFGIKKMFSKVEVECLEKNLYPKNNQAQLSLVSVKDSPKMESENFEAIDQEKILESSDSSDGESIDGTSEESGLDEEDFTLSDIDDEVNKQNESQKRVVPALVIIDGKPVSLRTLNCLKKLEGVLKLLRKKAGIAKNNGDCFWDAFAQRLSVILRQPITVQELRQKVSCYVQQLDKGPDEENWVKRMIKKEYAPMDTYENYRDRVAYDADEALRRELPSAIWGQEKRDGVILCRLYQVNLKVYEVGYFDDDPSKMTDMKNYWDSDARIYPQSEIYPHSVEIALYPGHFVPVEEI